MLQWEKRFYRNRGFSSFSSYHYTLVRFPIKIYDFGFAFHKISLSVIVQASWNINAMVIMETTLLKQSCSFWLLQTHFTKITNGVGIGGILSKIEPVRSTSKEILEINVLQKVHGGGGLNFAGHLFLLGVPINAWRLI